MVRGWGSAQNSQTSAAGLTRRRPFALSADELTWFLVALGVFLRILEYHDNRALYMDERSLLKNLVGSTVFDFHTTLTEEQLAPPGFLVVERLMVRLPMEVKLAGRLVPFLCAVASMFLFRQVGRRYVRPLAVPVAVGLFALADWLLYYSAEIKQYSGDLALTLAALLLAAGPADQLATWPAAMSRRWRFALAGFGVVGVWFSYPLALVLAGVGTYLIMEAASRKDWKRAATFLVMSMAWALSFAACYKVSHMILSKGRFIWDWWDFAFLPLPPRSMAALQTELWQLINVTNSPASVFTPVGVVSSAFLAGGLFLLGGAALGSRWRGGLYLLVSPLLFVLLASALHQYPFHGRLLLFVVPTVHLLVGEGAAVLTRRGGPLLTFALGAFLLVQPAYESLYFHMVQKRPRPHDSHGDLRPDLLDYLETLERTKSRSVPPRAGP